MNWKSYLQYQKPQAAMLTALSLPVLAGIYNFGWRVLLVVLVSAAICWATEFAFTRKNGKPATMAALVTAVLLALVLPPNVPLWQVIAGAVFAILFGKMAFGGFGRNVFNPAMVGRCFLYISFPATLAATWYAPAQGGAAGFARYTVTRQAASVEASAYAVDGVTSATALSATKYLNREARKAKAEGESEDLARAREAVKAMPFTRLLLGNVNGSMGETSAVAILLALIFLLYRKVVAWQLVVSPMLGMLLGKGALNLLGLDLLPFGESLALNYIGGGTLFACVFMVTEPVSAPNHKTARWIYGILIGVFAAIIRGLSVFNAGLMFSILLGNMFGPIIEVGCKEWDEWKKRRTEVAGRHGQ